MVEINNMWSLYMNITPIAAIVLVVLSIRASFLQLSKDFIGCESQTKDKSTADLSFYSYYCSYSSYYVPEPYNPFDDDVPKFDVRWYNEIPTIFFVMAVTLCIPYVMWKLFQGSSGLNFVYIMQLAGASRFPNDEARQKAIDGIALNIKEHLEIKACKTKCVGFGSSFYDLNMVTSLLTCFILLMQLVYMNYTFGGEEFYYGFSMLARIYDEDDMGVFPLRTFCNLTEFTSSRKNSIIVCYLLENESHATMFTLAWIMLCATLILEVGNFVLWMGFPGSMNRWHARSIMFRLRRHVREKNNNNVSEADLKKVKFFMHNILGVDGAYLLRLVQQGRVDTFYKVDSEICVALYDVLNEENESGVDFFKGFEDVELDLTDELETPSINYDLNV